MFRDLLGDLPAFGFIGAFLGAVIPALDQALREDTSGGSAGTATRCAVYPVRLDYRAAMTQ
jgi:hypothetical protein